MRAATSPCIGCGAEYDALELHTAADCAQRLNDLAGRSGARGRRGSPEQRRASAPASGLVTTREGRP